MSESRRPHPALAPALLVLALILAVAGFGVMTFGGPEVNMQLHEARVNADEDAVEVLEADLEKRKWNHRITVAALFAGAGAAIVFAILGTGSKKGFQ